MRIQWPRLQDNQSTCSPSLGFLVVWETENPNTLGNSFSKLFTMVLLPTPEGPQMTRGRMGLAGAILDKPDVDVKNEAVTDVDRDWVRLPIFKPNKRPSWKGSKSNFVVEWNDFAIPLFFWHFSSSQRMWCPSHDVIQFRRKKIQFYKKKRARLWNLLAH